MKLEHLIGKRVMGQACTKDYTDWAETMLAEGCESNSVAILAGLGFDKIQYFVDVENYFQKSLAELGLTLPTEEEGLLGYAIIICEEIDSEKISPCKGKDILLGIEDFSDNDKKYEIWQQLRFDIWCVGDGERPVTNIGMHCGNVDWHIIKCAKEFLKNFKVS